MTHQVKIAPPVKTTSVIFIAASIAIIEIKDMPIAVLKAKFSAIFSNNLDEFFVFLDTSQLPIQKKTMGDAINDVDTFLDFL